MNEHVKRDQLAKKVEERYEHLEQSKLTGPLVATTKRFVEVDGLSQGGLVAIELFTTIIPLMIIGFSYATGFAESANVGNLFIRQLGLTSPLDDMVRSAFGNSSGIQSTWTLVGVAGFMFWGIPMSITIATMFARAWRREQFPIPTRLGRGALWFVLYLVTTIVHSRVGFIGGQPGASRLGFLLLALIPVWIFWSITPVLLVRDGGRGPKYLILAGLAGVVIEGLVLPIAARITFPILLSGWTGFGPIGVAMTLMTWCGVIGVGWVVTACAGAVLWERNAPPTTVIESQTAHPQV